LPESKLRWSETYIDHSIKMRDEDSDEIQDAFGELAIGFPTERLPFNYKREIDNQKIRKLFNGLKRAK
jgi:hypothetical protein